MQVLIADLEGNDLLPGLRNLWCLGVIDAKTKEEVLYADQPGYPTIDEGLKRLQEADRVVFHNGLGYDYLALLKLYGRPLRFDQVWDSLIVSQMLCPERGSHALAAWGETFKFPKGDWKDFSAWHPEMGKYCLQDCRITLRIYRVLQSKLRKWLDKGFDLRPAIEVEHKVGLVIRLQEQHGFRLDVKKAQELEVELRAELMELEDELQKVFLPMFKPNKGKWDYQTCTWRSVEVTTPKVGNKTRGVTKGAPYCKVDIQPFNPGSRTQCVVRLTKLGWQPDKFTPAGQPSVDEAVLKDLHYPESKPLSRYFDLTKQLGQLADGDNAWLKLVNAKGYVHGRVNTVGARTNRMTHFAPNMAQVSKKDKRMREVWLPDVGHVLVGCDASGLELRMLGHDLAHFDGGTYAQAVVYGKSSEGTDAHTRAMKATGLFSRDNTKTLTYAFLYGSGNPNLGSIVISDLMEAGKAIPKVQPAALGKRVRDRMEEGIDGLKTLVAICKRRTKEVGYLKGLDGRPIMSTSQHSALNTRLQSSGAIVMKYALAIFHFELLVKEGWVEDHYFINDESVIAYCANVHDEAQMSCEPSKAERIGQLFADSIRIAGERLGLRCELAGEFAIGANWKETH